MMFEERRIAKKITTNGGYVYFSQLNPFRIRGARVTTAGDLRLLARCKGTRDVDARGLRLTDDVLCKQLSRLSSLRSVLLNNNLVGVKTIEALSAAPHLSFVSLIETGLTEEVVELLKTAKPECVVIHEMEELFSGQQLGGEKKMKDDRVLSVHSVDMIRGRNDQ